MYHTVNDSTTVHTALLSPITCSDVRVLGTPPSLTHSIRQNEMCENQAHVQRMTATGQLSAPADRLTSRQKGAYRFFRVRGSLDMVIWKSLEWSGRPIRFEPLRKLKLKRFCEEIEPPIARVFGLVLCRFVVLFLIYGARTMMALTTRAFVASSNFRKHAVGWIDRCIS
ncbi:hypothetical protein CC2G_000175 [Coprinopsis cinerea AmutBmut pab1-1]|nr:hypothetical protein CC2G_000175 [Coprinopsis cinerea AmutBmut pab1-1]